MCTRGGVETAEVDPKTMQSRLVKGLYLVGEVLDVDGDTGGYNLQAAFSTGMLAARSIKSDFDRISGEQSVSGHRNPFEGNNSKIR
jgi:predicted flavoprotein YhiN